MKRVNYAHLIERYTKTVNHGGLKSWSNRGKATQITPSLFTFFSSYAHLIP